MELQQVVDIWLASHKHTTRVSYGFPMRLFIEHMGASRLLTSITPIDLVRYVQSAINPRGYAPATYNKHIKTLRTFFSWCASLDLIASSPMRGAIKLKPIPRGVNRAKAMTDPELFALLMVVRSKPRDRALLLFLADTGCRRGGAAGLRVGDIDWVKNRATVTEKGDITRVVSFGDECAVALRVWLAYRAMHHVQRGVYLWTRDGKPIKAEQISQTVRRLCQKACIRVRSAHSLRFRKGFQFADARIAPTYAAAYLGHSDPTITVRHYYPDDYDTAEALGRELMTDSRTLSAQPPNVIPFRPLKKAE